MNRMSMDLSRKINPLTIELFEDIKKIAESIDIQFFVVGATARDILFDKVFDIKTRRATSDIDLAVNKGASLLLTLAYKLRSYKNQRQTLTLLFSYNFRN